MFDALISDVARNEVRYCMRFPGYASVWSAVIQAYALSNIEDRVTAAIALADDAVEQMGKRAVEVICSIR
jgi:hypothetical protein